MGLLVVRPDPSHKKRAPQGWDALSTALAAAAGFIAAGVLRFQSERLLNADVIGHFLEKLMGS